MILGIADVRVQGGPGFGDALLSGLLVLLEHDAHGGDRLGERERAGVDALRLQRVLGAGVVGPRGLDPSSLADLFYAFAQCGSLTTIYADASWALPAGVSGMGMFYNDTRLVGGTVTTYSSSAYGYARMVIDRAGQAGYLTGTPSA